VHLLVINNQLIKMEVTGAGCKMEVTGAGCKMEVTGAGCKMEVTGAGCKMEVTGAVCKMEVTGAGCKMEVTGTGCKMEVTGAGCKMLTLRVCKLSLKKLLVSKNISFKVCLIYELSVSGQHVNKQTNRAYSCWMLKRFVTSPNQ
jgi:hypothetical protein